MKEASRESLARAFDQEAARYDGKYAGNAVMDRLRAVFRRKAAAAFPPGAHILELGAGTGEETLWLLENGFRVTATDPSSEMLARLRARAHRFGPGVLETRVLSTRDLASAAPRSFDGAAAFWGPLNYDADIGPALAGTARLLKPGGRFLFTSVNRWCLWEFLSEGARGRFGRALRRTAPAVEVPVGEGRLPAFCPPFGAVAAAARAAGFRVKSWGGLGVFLPPPYMASPAGRPGGPRFGALSALETALAGRRPFSFFGDQLMFDLEVLS